MANIICPKCKHSFDNNNAESFVTRAAAATVGAVGGSFIGGSIGIVAGPVGGISGAIPGGIIGGITCWFTADQFRRCPKCGKIFKT